MKRFSLAIAAGLIVLGLTAPGFASAQMVELGQTSSTPITAPSCPSGVSASQCLIILTRTTAIQSNTNGLLNPTKVTKAGWIVGFTIGLSKLSTNSKTELGYIHGLDQQYGGTPQVALFSSSPFIILPSADRNALNNLHNSSAGTFFWPAA